MLETLRSFRIGEIALFDLLLGAIILMIIAYMGLLGEGIKNHYILFGVVGVIPIGEIFHLLFGIDTPILRYLRS